MCTPCEDVNLQVLTGFDVRLMLSTIYHLKLTLLIVIERNFVKPIV